MNKTVKLLVIVAAVVIAFGAVGSVYAQGGGPRANAEGVGTGIGNGFRGGNGERFNQNQRNAQGTMDGVLHDAWMAAYAEALDIPVNELEDRLAAGETMSEIAVSTGLTIEEFKDLMKEVRSSVIDQAVSEGALTREQAERMKSGGVGRGNGMGKRGPGAGSADCPNPGQNQ